jgi:hypothetical protein
VTDNGSPALSDFETISITVNEVNAAPVLAAIGNKSVNEGGLLTFTATATDSDSPANTKTFSLDAGAPTGASINASTGVFTWTPTESQGGTSYNVTVRVTDNGSPALSDFETISITVNEVNAAPVLAAIGNKSVNEGSLLTFTATATDSDSPANTKTFSLDAGAPTGASINASTGVFTWTPNASQGPATYNVTVRVTDNGSPALSDFETISVIVNNAPPPTIWGTVTQLQANGLANSGDQWYLVQASQTGYLTAEAFYNSSAGNIDLAWFDSSLQQLAAGVSGSNSARVEQAVLSGNVLLLRVSGTNADVDFRVTNLVALVGSTVNVSGTSQDDVITVSGGNSNTITVNGVAYTFASGAVTAINIDGKSGIDTVTTGVGSVASLRVTGVENATNYDAPANSVNLDLGLRFSTSYYTNYNGFNEKWLLGDLSWYFITPDGNLYRATNNAVLAANPLIAQFDASYYADPTLIHDAQTTNVMLDQQMLTQVANLALHFNGSYYLNWGGLGEKWVLGTGNQWYFITPDGTLYQWSGGSSVVGSTVVGNVGSSFHADPTLLEDPAQFGSFSVLNASQLNDSLNLHYGGSYVLNWGGWNEKWIKGAGGAWYFITPSGGFYEWSGHTGLANSRLVTSLDSTYYVSPNKLFDAPPPATASAGAAGVSLTQFAVGPESGVSSSLLVGIGETQPSSLQPHAVPRQEAVVHAPSAERSLQLVTRQSRLPQSAPSSDSSGIAMPTLSEAARTRAIVDLFSTTDDDAGSLPDTSVKNGQVSLRAIFSLFGA